MTVKWVRQTASGEIITEIKSHGGNPSDTIEKILSDHKSSIDSCAVVTGQAARAFFNLPYRPQAECLEKALDHNQLQPDILLSLGGETFSVFPLREGKVRNIISSSKCAAGTGEFIVQQFQRMGLSLEEGLSAAVEGKRVELATRCSVHCKLDATHKLNKGQCSPGDIADSLVYDLAKKVSEMVEAAQWLIAQIVIAGGVSKNELFLE